MREASQGMINVQGMEKSFQTGKLVNRVLRGVDLEVSAGDFLTIEGTSGSGKSTLLHALGGLDRDYSGTIKVDGRDLHKLSDVELSDYRNREVGFVFQAFNLLGHLSCRENVALPALFARGSDLLTKEQMGQRAQETLERVGLADKVDALPNTLSGGQKQRVAIARALFNQPRMLLCDEPTGNLDSKMSGQILDLFTALNEDGITVIIVTHDPNVSACAPRTVRVHDGKLSEAGEKPADSGRASDPDDADDQDDAGGEDDADNQDDADADAAQDSTS